MNIISLREYNLSINEFKEPKVAKGQEAISTLLVRLLLLEPGTFQSHPKMGVGLVSKYRYTEGKANELEQDFKQQIAQYLPYLQGVNVKVKQIKKHYVILCHINKAAFSIYFDTDNGSVKTSYSTFDDVKNR